RAHVQWDAVVAALRTAGAEVEVLDPVEGLPDLVFTANAGIVHGDRFVPARFRNPERQGEEAVNEAWFAGHGWRVDHLPVDLPHEGAGDALPFRDELVCGHRWRTDARAHVALACVTGATTRLVVLADERLYHLDMTFCPLDERRAMVTPGAYEPAGWELLRTFVPERIELRLDEALALTANAVVVGTTIVMTACPPRVGRRLEAWGFHVVVVDVSEFVKAGGGVRCLTLALDVRLGSPPAGDG
ncbi:MAG: NG,NG-dimethylarginine dimethylaminohydrolase 1, partial [Actinomycetia bacterium]|nr:NG,NG-dimethylarginine dimethylaminohydrolase 1 [Actinomycetes bacterium]